MVETALKDGHYTIRKMAVENLRLNDRSDLIGQLQQMAKGDPHSAVRGAAIKKLRGAEGVDLSGLITNVLTSEKSYKVIGDALETLSRENKDAALVEAVKLKGEKSAQLTGPISQILANSGDLSHLPYFEERLTNVSLFSVFNFYDSYYQLLSKSGVEVVMKKAVGLKEIATSPVENIFYKFTSTSTLNKLRNDLRSDHPAQAQEIAAMIAEIKAGETNELLQMRYGAF